MSDTKQQQIVKLKNSIFFRDTFFSTAMDSKGVYSLKNATENGSLFQSNDLI